MAKHPAACRDPGDDVDALTTVALEHPELAELAPAARRLALRELVLGGGGDPSEAARLADEIDGWGPLSDLMQDPEVTDILVNRHDDVRAERAGRLERTTVAFSDERHLRRCVQRWLGRAGARADASCPVADARLSDGSRLHVVLPPVSLSGPIVSIRRFPHRFSLADLENAGFIDNQQGSSLRAAVHGRRSIVIAGATGTGKTTLLNALLGEMDEGERVVTIEEVREISVPGRHVISLAARAANVEGKGVITLRDLVRASLRMRPDRIVVGEVRGAEVLDALDAMATGHRGSMITVHADSAAAVPARLVSLAMHSNEGSETSLARRISRALDIVVYLEKINGVRAASFVGTLRPEREDDRSA